MQFTLEFIGVNGVSASAAAQALASLLHLPPENVTVVLSAASRRRLLDVSARAYVTAADATGVQLALAPGASGAPCAVCAQLAATVFAAQVVAVYVPAAAPPAPSSTGLSGLTIGLIVGACVLGLLALIAGWWGWRRARRAGANATVAKRGAVLKL